MPVKPLSIYTHYHTSENFSLSVKHCKKQTKIIMNLQQEIINTRDIPYTVTILKNILPSVLQSMCYNEDNYPFCQEVLHTEVGHLFEHILIEYLCLLKVSNGYDSVEFSGVTKWNWLLYPKGSFHITVSASDDDAEIFAGAMQKSIELINLVLLSAKTNENTERQVLNQYLQAPALSDHQLQSVLS